LSPTLPVQQAILAAEAQFRFEADDYETNSDDIYALAAHAQRPSDRALVVDFIRRAFDGLRAAAAERSADSLVNDTLFGAVVLRAQQRTQDLGVGYITEADESAKDDL
jgi:hypothetical protein